MENKGRRLISAGILSLLLALSSLAQAKELLTDPGTIEMRVTQELDDYQQTEEWAKWIEKHPVKGMFAFDLTIWNKGEVVSIRALGKSEGSTIEDQNTLKNYLKAFKFNFKVPKGKRYKVTYNFMLE